MREIERIAILGAGAMGAAFASRFVNAPGLSTMLVAGGGRYERLTRHGLAVNGVRYHIPVVHPDQRVPCADLIIVALKNHHLAAAIPDLRNLVGDDTAIISIMNGLDSEDAIAAVHGAEKVLRAVSVGIDAVRQGGQVTYANPGVLYFGEARNERVSPRVRRVQRALDTAGIAYETPVDMVRMMWWKFMVNVGINQASAVMRAPYGVFHRSGVARGLMEALMREVVILAEASGVDLSKQDIADWRPILDSLAPDGKTSMLQDIEAGRKTEVEVFGGKACELGSTLGIPTPVNQTVVSIITVLEQTAD
jgi:2-dehydropantoate 2-reductase